MQGIMTTTQGSIGKVTSSVYSQLWPELTSIYKPSSLPVIYAPSSSVSFEVKMIEIQYAE